MKLTRIVISILLVATLAVPAMANSDWVEDFLRRNEPRCGCNDEPPVVEQQPEFVQPFVYRTDHVHRGTAPAARSRTPDQHSPDPDWTEQRKDFGDPVRNPGHQSPGTGAKDLLGPGFCRPGPGRQATFAGSCQQDTGRKQNEGGDRNTGAHRRRSDAIGSRFAARTDGGFDLYRHSNGRSDQEADLQ